ncbi:class I SAM-dependent methyltransferase, partial [bacterium]|nr:class I SAM-dependent methyltransferase [bacterium]
MGREWWEGFFDRAWLEGGFGAIPEEQSRREAELIAGLLDLKPGMEVLDLCCGIGRISVPLA